MMNNLWLWNVYQYGSDSLVIKKDGKIQNAQEIASVLNEIEHLKYRLKNEKEYATQLVHKIGDIYQEVDGPNIDCDGDELEAVKFRMKELKSLREKLKNHFKWTVRYDTNDNTVWYLEKIDKCLRQLVVKNKIMWCGPYLSGTCTIVCEDLEEAKRMVENHQD